MRLTGLLLTLGFIQTGTCDPIAIIGGQDNLVMFVGEPYAGFASSSGAAAELFGPTLNGIIQSVAMNDSCFAIIGGQDNNSTSPYAAFISPSGAATQILDPMANGSIRSVAINNSGNGIIGGIHNAASPYAALVFPSGAALQISGPGAPTGLGDIRGAAINDSGAGIIGGIDSGFASVYAAIVSPSGVATEVSGAGAPIGAGIIRSVAINQASNSIIGGSIGANAYAAHVSPSGAATEIVTGATDIRSVAMNDSGAGVIGGVMGGLPYAALVSPSGVATPVSGPSAPAGAGLIYSVAINETGTAIVGGTDNGSVDPYVAFISPSGSVTEITGVAATSAEVFGVAINNAGAAIVGGRENVAMNVGEPFAALIAPSGIVTRISGAQAPIGFGSIQSVAIKNLTPVSYGPDSSVPNGLFSLSSQILSNHLAALKIRPDIHPALLKKEKEIEEDEIAFLADASDVVDEPNGPSRNKSQYAASQNCPEKPRYCLWAAPFGVYSHQKKQGNFTAIDNWIAGALAAFDYYGVENAVIGGGAAYLFNYAHISEGVGHAKIDQEFLTLYGSWTRKNFFVELTLWGGLYQMKNVRHSLFGITSTSKVDGWLFDPHLEISSPVYAKGDWLLIDPFAMFDWVNNWQGRVLEKGASGFNLDMGHQYASLLRSELGLRFYEALRYGCGTIVLQEKASWVNKFPTSSATAQAILVGGASTFDVEIFSDQTQNLGVVQLNSWFYPSNNKYPYGSLNFQGEFGTSFQNYLLSFELGKEF